MSWPFDVADRKTLSVAVPRGTKKERDSTEMRGQRGLAHLDRAAARHRRLAGSGVSRVIAGPAVEPDLRPVLPGDDPKASRDRMALILPS
jgi:hypothetical protein